MDGSSGLVLECYCSTSDNNTVARLRGSMDLQKSVDKILGRSRRTKRILVCDNVISSLNDDAFFDDIRLLDPFVVNNALKAFCLSKFRNASIRIARNIGADWLMLCDADTVNIGGLNVIADYPFCIPSVYWQPENESLAESLDVMKAGEGVFSSANSWFIMHRTMFNKIDFNELIYGYGYEDIEFYLRAHSLGFKLKMVENHTVLHRYHPSSDRNINNELMERNKGIAEAFGVVYRAFPDYDWRDCATLSAIHPEWNEELIICPSIASCIQPSKSALGKLRFVEGVRGIDWGNGIVDRFDLTDGVLVFKDRILTA